MSFDRLRHIVRLRWRSLFGGAQADHELDEELRDHVDRQVEVHVAAGMRPDEARRAALLAIGGLERCKEEMRDARRIAIVENLMRDLRMACRQLRKHPAFTFTAVASLALGIGANTAIFQLLNALTLRVLPVKAPHELVELRTSDSGKAGRHTGRNRQLSLAQYQEVLVRQQAFSSFAAFGDTRFNLARQGEIQYVDGLWVSGNFFETLGVTPAIGRLIGPSDDVSGCGAGVAVISSALWHGRFGGRADIVGQTLPGPGGTVIPIIGVTPPAFFGFEVGRQFGVAVPMCAAGITRRDHWWLAGIGRLKPGWTAAQAQAHLQGILPDVQRAAMPDYRSDWQAEYLTMTVQVVDASAGVSPLRQSYRRPLWILMAVAGLVLLIASVNLANLLLARATARRQEFAVRLAIGGTKRRVLQQVLVESVLLAALGSIAAFGVAVAVSRSILPLMSTAADRIHLDLSMDWRVFGFTSVVGLATSLVFGLAPALRLAGTPVAGRGGRGTAGNDGSSIRRVLVSAQIAVTLVLLFGGLLFLRTFRNLSTQDTGVHERGVIVASVFFLDAAQPEQRRTAAFRELDARLRAMPGVVSMAETYTTPLGGTMSNTEIEIDRRRSDTSVNINWVSPGYFATLGTPILAGRDFDSRDVPQSTRVVLVTKSLADRFFGGAAIGKRFTVPDDRGGVGVDYEVIGIVADQKYYDIRESNPLIFFPASSQQEQPGLLRRYVVRAAGPAAQSIDAITRTVAAFDPTATIRYAMLDDQLIEALLQERLMARLSALFGAVALVLAIVGLYGVVSYAVASRRAEIGIRVALGATRSRILGMILGDVGRILAVGVIAGGILALAAGRGIGSLLFGVDGSDAVTLAVATALLTAAGFLSAALPARRAAAVDPVSALRES